MAIYREIEINILGHSYKFRVDEPEEMINRIKNDISEEVEKYAKKFGKDNVDYILLLLLLNERLKTDKANNEINKIMNKIEKSVHSSAP